MNPYKQPALRAAYEAGLRVGAVHGIDVAPREWTHAERIAWGRGYNAALSNR